MVRTARNTLTEMVMDPSIAQGPLTIAQWTSAMSSASFTRMTLSDVESLLEASGGGYPANQPLVFTTEREAYYPPRPGQSTGPRQAGALHEGNRPRISGYARLAEVHGLAATIRGELQQTPIHVGNIVDAINHASSAARAQLWISFPRLRDDIRIKISNPADMQRIEDAVSQP
jgi:hypothetical protein